MAKSKSRQKKHGGGKFKSERQRRWMWANAPKVAKKWSHNRKTSKRDWKGVPGYGRGGYVPYSKAKGGKRNVERG